MAPRDALQPDAALTLRLVEAEAAFCEEARARLRARAGWDLVQAGPAALAPLAVAGMVRIGPDLALSPARARRMGEALIEASAKAAAQGPAADPPLALAATDWLARTANGVRASTILRLWRSGRSTPQVLAELRALGVAPALVGLALETGEEDSR